MATQQEIHEIGSDKRSLKNAKISHHQTSQITSLFIGLCNFGSVSQLLTGQTHTGNDPGVMDWGK
jgi:hypothetical protein